MPSSSASESNRERRWDASSTRLPCRRTSSSSSCNCSRPGHTCVAPRCRSSFDRSRQRMHCRFHCHPTRLHTPTRAPAPQQPPLQEVSRRACNRPPEPNTHTLWSRENHPLCYHPNHLSKPAVRKQSTPELYKSSALSTSSTWRVSSSDTDTSWSRRHATTASR